MADNLYDFEALRAAGTTFVIDDGTGNDWVFINGTYPAVPGHTGPDTTMGLYDGRYFATFGLVTAVTVWDSASTFYTITFARPIENIRGSASDDRIDGNDLANVLVGDATDVAGGADWLIGGIGNDTLLGVGGSDNLWGGDNDDVIYGDNDPFSQDQGNFASGDDVLRGENGNDTLFGGFGSNTLTGGAGLDTADYSGFFDEFGNTTFAITGSLNTGLVTVIATDMLGDSYVTASDTLQTIETLVGSVGDDTLFGFDADTLPADTFGQLSGGAGNDEIFGGRFLDIIYGGNGNDRLHDGGFAAPPGNGNDALMGGLGDDIAYVTDASTVVFELADAGTDLVITSVSFTLGANVENLTMLNASFTPLDGTGNSSANRIYGNFTANRLNGLENMDSLYGGDGNDTLRGGSETDYLFGGAQEDGLYGGDDYDSLSGDAGADILDGGNGNDSLFGGTEADRVFGRAGDDLLSGGLANDRLQGGTGQDRLTGGTGHDIFVFASAAEAGMGSTRDRITDFVSGSDRIDLQSLMTGQVFIGSLAFSGDAGQVRFDDRRSLLLGDLDGDRAADWQIALQLGATVSESDLIL